MNIYSIQRDVRKAIEKREDKKRLEANKVFFKLLKDYKQAKKEIYSEFIRKEQRKEIEKKINEKAEEIKQKIEENEKKHGTNRSLKELIGTDLYGVSTKGAYEYGLKQQKNAEKITKITFFSMLSLSIGTFFHLAACSMMYGSKLAENKIIEAVHKTLLAIEKPVAAVGSIIRETVFPFLSTENKWEMVVHTFDAVVGVIALMSIVGIAYKKLETILDKKREEFSNILRDIIERTTEQPKK